MPTSPFWLVPARDGLSASSGWRQMHLASTFSPRDMWSGTLPAGRSLTPAVKLCNEWTAHGLRVQQQRQLQPLPKGL